MCLLKILHIISSIPPSKEEAFPSNNNKGVGIDLNLRFCSVTESGESESSAETASNANSAIEQGNNNNEGGEEDEGEEGIREKSGDTQVQSFEVDDNNNNIGVDHVESELAETSSFQGRGGEGNCLDLLIEAARVLSGKDESDSEGELTSRGGESEGGGRVIKKRKERWVVVDLYGDDVVQEEREPVVRSKRGRNQALPYRFRDSVLEPLNARVVTRDRRQLLPQGNDSFASHFTT